MLPQQNLTEGDRLRVEQLRHKLAILTELQYREAKKHLFQFALQAFKVIEPAKTYRRNWHIGYVCEHLEAVHAGEILSLIIEEPPGHMKSSLVSIIFPVWSWDNDATSRWLFSSYSKDLGTDFSLKRRRLIESEWHIMGFSTQVQLVGDRNRISEMENSATGSYVVTSTGGSTGGKHADYIIVDDPVNPERDQSKADLDEGRRHVEYITTTRRKDPKTSRVVYVGQRLHETDPSGVLRENFPHTVVIKLPVVAPTTKVFTFPRSGYTHTWNEGDYLWADRMNPETLQNIKNSLGPWRFSAQYMQEPVPPGGQMIERGWWKRFTARPTKPTFRVIALDTAVKAKQENDYTAAAVIEEDDDGFYLVAMVRKKLQAAMLEDFVADLQATYNADAIVIEDASSGQRVIQYYQTEKKLPVVAFKPSAYGDKVQRLSRVAPTVAAKKVALPDNTVLNEPWVAVFLEELDAFPRGAHDDQVDAFSTGMIYLILERKVGKFNIDVQAAIKRANPTMPSMKSERQW